MTPRALQSRPCACGCDKVVQRKHGRLRQYASRACFGRAVKEQPRFATFRRRRALAASQAARRARIARAIAAAAKYPNRARAYQAGYRTGFNAAARWWKSRYARLLQGKVAA